MVRQLTSASKEPANFGSHSIISMESWFSDTIRLCQHLSLAHARRKTFPYHFSARMVSSWLHRGDTPQATFCCAGNNTAWRMTHRLRPPSPAILYWQNLPTRGPFFKERQEIMAISDRIQPCAYSMPSTRSSIGCVPFRTRLMLMRFVVMKGNRPTPISPVSTTSSPYRIRPYLHPLLQCVSTDAPDVLRWIRSTLFSPSSMHS
ncbi:MAG: hypothetical protein BWY82_02436 [Verrucomicrobia bacterium ADurb.Bin474]|nr:MAG: hypothetical protein BWY82_02436 [Verrucomicrobia bacterium ADurb.Bin474]